MERESARAKNNRKDEFFPQMQLSMASLQWMKTDHNKKFHQNIHLLKNVLGLRALHPQNEESKRVYGEVDCFHLFNEP